MVALPTLPSDGRGDSGRWSPRRQFQRFPCQETLGQFKQSGIQAAFPAMIRLSSINFSVVSSANSPPRLLLSPASQNVAAATVLALGVVATGGESLNYQWNFGGQAMIMPTNWFLDLPAFSAEQQGEYQIVVSNASGAVTNTFTLALQSGGDQGTIRLTPLVGRDLGRESSVVVAGKDPHGQGDIFQIAHALDALATSRLWPGS